MKFKHSHWRHKDNTTVAFTAEKCFYIVEKDLYKLKVLWWNIGACHGPWPMGITQKIEIKGSDVPNWIRLPDNKRITLPESRVF